MAMRLDSTVGTVTYDNLIASNVPETSTFMVTLAESQGVLKRGTLLTTEGAVYGGATYAEYTCEASDNPAELGLYEKTESGYVLTDDTEPGQGVTYYEQTVHTPDAVLADDVDTEQETKAIAYRTGHFYKNALIVGEDYALTAEDREVLRTKGILLSDAIKA